MFRIKTEWSNRRILFIFISMNLTKLVYKCLILLLLLAANSAFAQTKTIQSVQQQLEQAADEERAALYIELSTLQLDTNPEASLEWGLLALRMAKNNRQRTLEAHALECMANASFKLNEFETSIRYYQKALDLSQNLNLGDLKSRLHVSVAAAYFQLKNYKTATQHLNIADDLQFSKSDEISRSKMYYYLAKLNLINKNLDDSKRQIELAIKHFNTLQNKSNANTDFEIALYWAAYEIGKELELESDQANYLAKIIAISKNDNLAKAQVYLGEIFIEKNNLAEAIDILEKAEKWYSEKKDKVNLAKTSTLLGTGYLNVGNNKLAMKYLQQSLNIENELGRNENIILTLTSIGNIHLYQNQADKAIETFQLAIDLANSVQLYNPVYDLAKKTAAAYKAQNNSEKAFEYMEIAMAAKDSLYMTESQEELAELNVRYEAEKRKRENELLRKNAEIQQLEYRQIIYYRRYLIAVLVLIAMLLMFVFARYRLKKKEIDQQKKIEKRIIDLNKQLEQRVDEEVQKSKEHELLLAQKSKMESLGKLAAGIAHEINQPLGGISMGLENIKFKLENNTLKEDYLQNKIDSLFENIKRIQKIIDHVRSFSRAHKPIAIEKINVNKVIDDALSMVDTQFKNHGIQLVLDLHEDLGFTIGDKYKLEQVLINLFTNAKYAVDKRGEAEEGFIKVISIRTFERVSKIYIEVEDNGIGIDKESQGKIFDPFFTTKQEDKGTGLGLSITYGFIKEMKGDIAVRSEPGKYTIFEIKLPKY